MRNRGWLRWCWIVVLGLLIGCSKKEEAEDGAVGSKKKAPSYFDDEDTIPEPTPKPPTDVDLVRLAAIQYRPRDYESSKDRLVVWTRLSNGKDERILGESPDGYQGPVWLTKSLDTMIYFRACKAEECAHPKMDENVFMYDFRTKEKKALLPKTTKYYRTKGTTKHFDSTGFIFGKSTGEEDKVYFRPGQAHLDLQLSVFYVRGLDFSSAINLRSGKVLSWPASSTAWVYLGNGRFLMGDNYPNGVPASLGEYDLLKGKVLRQESESSPIQLGGSSSSQDGRLFLQLGGPNFTEPKMDSISLYGRERNLFWRKLIYPGSHFDTYEIDPYGKWMYFGGWHGYFRISLLDLERLKSPVSAATLVEHSESVVEASFIQEEAPLRSLGEDRRKFRTEFYLVPL